MPQSPQTAKAKFEMTSWDEKSIVEYEEGRKLTHAKVTKKFTGDLEGESVLEYLMVYPPAPPVPYYDGTAKEKATIIADSGTGDLARLRGSWSFGAGHEDKLAGFDIEYWWA